MELTLTYTAPTIVTARAEATTVQLATDTRRPVAFHGRVREPLRLRQMLLALQRCLGVEDDEGDAPAPVLTVHRDQIFIEAFSGDGSAYLRLSMPMSAFESDGTVRPGTTTMRFSPELEDALGMLRSSRPTEIVIGGGGLMVNPGEVAPPEAMTQQVAIPQGWLKGFLQVQSALTQPSFSFDARPTDMLSVLAFLDENIAKRSPRGLRYILTPDAPIALVLEPWEQRYELRGTHYTGYPRTVRVWGRKRLSFLRDALPFADRLTVSLLGRGLPHIYTCMSGPFHLLLAVPGWGVSDWASGGVLDLMAAQTPAPTAHVEQVRAALRAHLVAPIATIATETGLSVPEVEHAMVTLCRAGQAMADFEQRTYRLRELFPIPIDPESLFPPDPRVAKAQRLAENAANVQWRMMRSPSGRREMRIDADFTDGDEHYHAFASVDDNGKLRFGQCECAFFQAYIMSRGPCEHILAARLLVDSADAIATRQRSGGV
jgi:hypothetical protein